MGAGSRPFLFVHLSALSLGSGARGEGLNETSWRLVPPPSAGFILFEVTSGSEQQWQTGVLDGTIRC